MKKLSALLFDPAHIIALLITFQVTSVVADSLWKPDSSPTSIFADKKARRVGDIITVVVQQNNSATRNDSLATSKQTAVDASISSFLYGPGASGFLTKGGKYPAMSFGGKNTYAGSGQIANAETITDQIAVQVIDVLPNGNLVIEGRRHSAFSGEKQDAILRGTVRYDDILANNTVFSYNIANATIQFVGKGTVSDAQRKGWFNRIWDKVNPF